MESITQFMYSDKFWPYHGFVLSGLWVLGSALGIFFKKFSTILHVIVFAVVDFTTLFFAGAALVRVSGHMDKFMQWSPLKQGHIGGGIIFLVLVLLQHAGGLTAFLRKQKNPQHRSFGKILVIIGRVIAACGWILGGNEQNAMVVGVVSIVLLILSLIIGEESNVEVVRKESRFSQARSPKGKRE